MHIKCFSGKPKRKKPLERPWCRWECNIRMALTETGCKPVDLIHLLQDRDHWRGSYKHGNQPLASRKGGEFLD
jgi:hypothetical protein